MVPSCRGLFAELDELWFTYGTRSKPSVNGNTLFNYCRTNCLSDGDEKNRCSLCHFKGTAWHLLLTVWVSQVKTRQLDLWHVSSLIQTRIKEKEFRLIKDGQMSPLMRTDVHTEWSSCVSFLPHAPLSVLCPTCHMGDDNSAIFDL